MKAKIEVEDRKEAELIRRGLQHAETRALVKVMGAMLPLDDRERRRTMNYIMDKFDLGMVTS